MLEGMFPSFAQENKKSVNTLFENGYLFFFCHYGILYTEVR